MVFSKKDDVTMGAVLGGMVGVTIGMGIGGPVGAAVIVGGMLGGGALFGYEPKKRKKIKHIKKPKRKKPGSLLQQDLNIRKIFGLRKRRKK